MTDQDILNDSQADNDSAGMRMSESQERLQKYMLYPVKPEDIDHLWNAEDPCMRC